MPNEITLKLLLLINASWCVDGEVNAKRVFSKHQIPLSDRRSIVSTPANDVILKFRDIDKRLCIDLDAHLLVPDSGKVLLHSDKLAKEFQKRDLTQSFALLLLEQIDDVLRATCHFMERARLQALADQRPELRLFAYGIPPSSVVEIEPSYSKDGMHADGVYDVLLAEARKDDPALFSIHTETFLNAPHIVIPLLSHLASLSAEDNLKFPVQLKRLADQFRSILEMEASPLRIGKIKRDHIETWANAQGKRFAYLDGGVAKIAGLPGTEPTAIRVGIYSARAGDTSLDTRETWDLQPFVVGDIIDKNTGVPMDDDDQIDLRRLGEAARYTLEPLTGLRFIETNGSVSALFAQGPLINQFVMYDEGEPHFVPFLKTEFLDRVGISRADVERVIKDIPIRNGHKMWRQFMAVYGYVAHRVFENDVPFMGVVERSAGMWLAGAVLDGAVSGRIVTLAYKKKVMNLLKKYGISDDFLFGCVLAEGEYITPVVIPKNDARRARDPWRPVVGQYPKPFATMLKTSEFSFPFRVEMNKAAKSAERDMLQVLYHTARLLPRYAFPVGLDIVDKYAKVPQWLSGRISARLAATVLNRAMAEGDSRLVAQVRQLLAHAPRDFFYRPNT